MAIDQIGGLSPSLTPAPQPSASSPAQASPSVSVASSVTATASPEPAKPTKEPTQAQVTQAMNEVQKAVAPLAQELQFSIDKGSGKTVVKVMDTGTHKVVRQIPSEEILAMAQQLDKLQGLLVKDKA